MKRIQYIVAIMLAALLVTLGACGAEKAPQPVETKAAGTTAEESVTVAEQETVATASEAVAKESVTAEEQIEVTGAEVAGQSVEAMSATGETEPAAGQPATLLYMGHASLRLTTPEGAVIYVDPFAGEQYDLPADLILVTHAHYDHSNLDKVANRADNCRIITQAEALADGKHQTFEIGGTTIEAVEAGNNDNHSITECVGYVLTFSNGKSVYVSGDTSTTQQMSQLSERKIDYAFFCCDGVYNMSTAEAAECAALVGAAHNIPYHVIPADAGIFDRAAAEQFNAENRLIFEPGEEIEIQ